MKAFLSRCKSKSRDLHLLVSLSGSLAHTTVTVTTDVPEFLEENMPMKPPHEASRHRVHRMPIHLLHIYHFPYKPPSTPTTMPTIASINSPSTSTIPPSSHLPQDSDSYSSHPVPPFPPLGPVPASPPSAAVSQTQSPPRSSDRAASSHWRLRWPLWRSPP